jgi:hypothetical protein
MFESKFFPVANNCKHFFSAEIAQNDFEKLTWTVSETRQKYVEHQASLNGFRVRVITA